MSNDALSQPMPWNLVADAYRSNITPHFEKYASELLSLVPLDPTMHVLDVACGPGTLSFLAAPRVGHVSAIDFAPNMLEQLRTRVREAGVRNLSAELMDAQHLTFHDGTFDAVFCSFGMMFVPDRARALEEMRRVLRPGGRVAIATWSTIDKRPLMQLAFAAARDALGAPTPPKGPLQSIEECEGELRAAGFHDPIARTFDEDAVFPSVDAYWKALMSGGAPMAVMRATMTVDAWHSVERRVLQALRERVGEGELRLSAEAILTVATR